MKISNKSILIMLVGIFLFVNGVYYFLEKYTYINTEPENIKIYLYIQDKEIAKTIDCGITQKIEIEIPETNNVLDASLRKLFEIELYMYADFESVSILNGVAKINVKNKTFKEGTPITSLSSCQIQHLFSTVTDTISQYQKIDSVEFYLPEGKIEF